MERAVAIVIALTLAVCCACSTESVAGPPSLGGVSPAPVPPASALPEMTSQSRAVDLTEIAAEATHPDELRAVLEEAGFAVGAQRSFTGGRGAFSRVLARGLAFASEEGAADYLAWFEDQATEEIIAAERLTPRRLPSGVVAFVREPSGCCHNEVRTYLVAWRRGPSVLSVSAAGRRATDVALVDLVLAIDEAT